MPQEKCILVVDDEPAIQDLIRQNLELRAFKVLIAATGLEALAQFDQSNVVLVVLDIMLPGMNGIEVCKRLRQLSTVPIIMLTALGEEADIIAALEQGADDYLIKPFSMGELVARVRALLRRTHWTDEPVSLGTLRVGKLEIDFENQQVWRESEPVKLSPTEFAVLRELAVHRGKILTHEALLRRVWGTEYRTEAEYLRVYVGRLRRKLEDDPPNPAHILTEPGIGYYMAK